ncbi:heme-dependent oxidative N-demethylase subunit alpha family protein [Deinococcus frigens]|uniref:heme-dependent oxidative N-demethylase subunit alpha family protein n=1 Tax=Deinococcus frigens TaxID=249403 RepID=UPI0004982E39|nr:heme-dependent oxidative N-demethylase subunit alpha family protein [Deinococcus frigens]
MPAPTVYRPFLNGVYTVSAGLLRLGAGLAGQPIPWREDGAAETHTFALEGDYKRFVVSKWAAHRRALHEYAGEANLSPELRVAALEFTARTLAADSGGAMTWDGQTFRNELLGWKARLDLRWGGVQDLRRFGAPLAGLRADLEPLGALDFLGLNAPEDLAIIARDPQTGRDWLAATHVLSPERWDPRDKLGRDFVAVHSPVAGAGPMNATVSRLVDAVIGRGPFVRFVWGIALDYWLDHHPATLEPGEAAPFDPDTAFVRVERQTLTGFPAAHGALFTIRPYLYPLEVAVQTPAQARALAAALRTMTPGQQIYKGLRGILPNLLIWLDERAL